MITSSNLNLQMLFAPWIRRSSSFAYKLRLNFYKKMRKGKISPNDRYRSKQYFCFMDILTLQLKNCAIMYSENVHCCETN